MLDRVVGYPLCNLLGSKVTRGLSAGRVQSVAVRLIVEREREIEAFKSEEYWRLTALLCPEELRAGIDYASEPARTKIYSKKKASDAADDDVKDEPAAEEKETEEKGTDEAPVEGPAIPKPPKDAFAAVLSKWNGREAKITNEQQADEYRRRAGPYVVGYHEAGADRSRRAAAGPIHHVDDADGVEPAAAILRRSDHENRSAAV